MKERNPYSISFGRIPNQYISRDILIDDIVDTLNSDIVEEQAFKLTGIRGSGKTVTLSAIERELRDDKKWIVVDLKPGADLTSDLVANLYSEVPFITDFIDSKLNLSAFGIGLNLSKKSPVASMDAALKKLMGEISKKKKRVLVCIDEVRKTDGLIDFIQEFQILIREDLPIYLIVAGLYEDIEDIENTDGLTFFLRAEKYEMTPLSIKVISADYKTVLHLSDDVSQKLAQMTKGYAFAYQAFGKYMWESGTNEINDIVLAKVDEALSEKVYKKIWSELAPRDKMFLSYIVKDETLSTSDLLRLSGKNHSEWSEPRKRLIDKGIIDGSIRGRVSLKLPRFREFTEQYQS